MKIEGKFEINDIVISTRFGIGLVTGSETIGGSNYLTVSCRETHAKILVPQKDLTSLRKLARPEEMNLALVNKTTAEALPEFPSKKDRVLYFKEKQGRQSLEERVQLIRHLSELADKGKVEDAILQSVESILIKEVELVFNLSYSQASDKVQQALRLAA